MKKKELFQHLQQQENRKKSNELEYCYSCKKWREFCPIHGTLDRYNVHDIDKLKDIQPQIDLSTKFEN